MGVNTAYVISDMDFYAKLGLTDHKHYTFYKVSKSWIGIPGSIIKSGKWVE